MALSRDDLAVLLKAFEEYGWSELTLSVNGTRLELTSSGQPPASRADAPAAAATPVSPSAPAASEFPSALAGPASPAEAAAPEPEPEPAPAAAPAGTEGWHDVVAPSVGIFYVAPAPGAPPFAEIGAHVDADDIVCIVEVMKLMNHVKAGVTGVVRVIHAENGTMVEHGQRLFSIEPGA
jgi:acetyl-CoA carboxylase biotin carboxyl carrier protein